MKEGYTYGKRNTRFSFYKSEPYKNTRLQRPKNLEHAKNIAGFQRSFPLEIWQKA